ncbi:phage terminase small subunit [Streptomyces achromogenes]|uniref:phage terminase small subunit n=1 Tax=Streptomyces achromogenes TaxID=67255 RepID=UPI0040388EFC
MCEDLSYCKKSGKRSGQMLQTIYSAFERLLVAEGDRRRVRIELHEPEPEVKRLDWMTGRLASLSKDCSVR